MQIGLAYNEKPDPRAVASDEPPSSSDAYAEWDEPSTITAVEQALGLFGRVVRLEADALFPQKLALARPDLVFNMDEGLHGPNREAHDPASCEFRNVPYTGSDPLTLAIALHKGRPKEILRQRGVPTAPFVLVERAADLERVELPFPLFVKPAFEGSGKGIFVNNLCDSPVRLRERVLFLLETYAQPVLVETYLPGDEYTVAILGNGAEVRCLPVVGFDFSTLPAGVVPVSGHPAKWTLDIPQHPIDIVPSPPPGDPSRRRFIEHTRH